MTRRGLPGNPLIWILIVSEVLVFALALVAFLVMRLLHLRDFQAMPPTCCTPAPARSPWRCC
jgi:heme/copper-type cytochrome/quinol oxidase subunit 3